MDDLQFYDLFNSMSVISGRREDDNERLFAVETRLRLKRFRFERGSNSKPLDQQASALTTELPGLLYKGGEPTSRPRANNG